MSDLISARRMREKLGGISTMTEYRWEKLGLLKPIRINGRKYYNEMDLEPTKLAERSQARALAATQIPAPPAAI